MRDILRCSHSVCILGPLRQGNNERAAIHSLSSESCLGSQVRLSVCTKMNKLLGETVKQPPGLARPLMRSADGAPARAKSTLHPSELKPITDWGQLGWPTCQSTVAKVLGHPTLPGLLLGLRPGGTHSTHCSAHSGAVFIALWSAVCRRSVASPPVAFAPPPPARLRPQLLPARLRPPRPPAHGPGSAETSGGG